MTTSPKDLIVGDLYDDIKELKRLVGGGIPTAVDIERLARVLTAISEEYSGMTNSTRKQCG